MRKILFLLIKIGYFVPAFETSPRDSHSFPGRVFASSKRRNNVQHYPRCWTFFRFYAKFYMALPTGHRGKGGVKIVDTVSNAKNEKGELIFRMYITTKDGRRIYRKNGRPFCFRANK